MIDLPPEQVIEHRLVECGFNPSGFTVIYEDDMQSIVVAIKPEAGAKREQFGCIHGAAALEIVLFSDLKMYREYSDYVTELFRPEMLENARQSLKKIGKLEGFPTRSTFSSDKLFAEAIEAHCGIPKGSVLKQFGDSIAFMPPSEYYKDFDRFIAKYDCLQMAIRYVAGKRELDIGLIGNEAIDEKEQK